MLFKVHLASLVSHSATFQSMLDVASQPLGTEDPMKMNDESAEDLELLLA